MPFRAGKGAASSRERFTTTAVLEMAGADQYKIVSLTRRAVE